MIDKWDERFMELARMVATWSKDPSTKVGAVITEGKLVVGLGYNGFPADVDDDPELLNDREQRLLRTIHAEDNALAMANGRGGSIYVTMHPCAACAARIVRHGGIGSVFCPAPGEELARWSKDFDAAMDMFRQAGLEVIYV